MHLPNEDEEGTRSQAIDHELYSLVKVTPRGSVLSERLVRTKAIEELRRERNIYHDCDFKHTFMKSLLG